MCAFCVPFACLHAQFFPSLLFLCAFLSKQPNDVWTALPAALVFHWAGERGKPSGGQVTESTDVKKDSNCDATNRMSKNLFEICGTFWKKLA